ncbi:MAG: MerR family transcriptional regulator [Dysgonomonas sp.]
MLDLENSNKLYYSIKEVASHFDVNESLLRFWEKEFEEINPRKTEKGARQYTKKDIETISIIYSLVRERGLTLEGARQTLRIKKDEETRRMELIRKLENIKEELSELKNSLESL